MLKTQREQILNLLFSARGGWVPLPKIAACAAQYNARVLELRRLGYRIANRTQDVNGVRHSWFRLESGPSPAVIAKSAASFTETTPLFSAGNIPERWADPEEGYR